MHTQINEMLSVAIKGAQKSSRGLRSDNTAQ